MEQLYTMKGAMLIPDVAGDKAPKGTGLHKPMLRDVGFPPPMKA